MFKAWDRPNEAHLVSLTVAMENWEAARERGRRGDFVCPECQAKVIFRAGPLRRAHFAHLPGGAECLMARESADLQAGRAVLFDWLRMKFGDAVTVEHRPDGIAVPRPIDVWVERDGHRPIAYWLFDKRPNRSVRDAVATASRTTSIEWHTVFLSRMLDNEEEAEGRVNLSSFELEFIQKSDYDRLYPCGEHAEGSLHYFDPYKLRVVSLRAVRATTQVTRPETVRRSLLSEMKIGCKTGALVHPGEYERLMDVLGRGAAKGASPSAAPLAASPTGSAFGSANAASVP